MFVVICMLHGHVTLYTDHVLGDAGVGGEGGDALGRGGLLQDGLDRRVAVQGHQFGQFLGILTNEARSVWN